MTTTTERNSDEREGGGSSVIRRATPCDVPLIIDCVEAVVASSYGHLFASGRPPPPEASDPWATAWLVETAGEIVGVGLAIGDRIEDLWIVERYRDRRFGTALLSRLEEQIGQSAHEIARLRVISSNIAALRFYRRNGWREVRSYPHELWHFEMIDMSKCLRSDTTQATSREIDASFKRIEATGARVERKLTELPLTSAKAADLQRVQVDLAEVKGRISTLPTWWMLMVTVLSTWTVGAGIVFNLVKATHP